MSSSRRGARSPTGSVGERPVALLKRVVNGDEQAWKRFVEEFHAFLFAVAWRYARGDVDVASELVLVALEGLRKPDAGGTPFYRLRKYLDSLDRFGRRSRFVTWLALVARNLFRDWFREREGRRLLPREVAGLGGVEQELFRSIFWDGMGESAACSRTATRHGLSRADCSRHLDHLMAVLAKKDLLRIYKELIKRPPTVPTGVPPQQDGAFVRDIVDPHPASRPDLALDLAEDQELAAEVARLLDQAVASLGPGTRNVLLLHTLQGCAGDEIQRIMGMRKRQKVYDELAKARRQIRRQLAAAGIDAQTIERVIGLVDSGLSGKRADPGPDRDQASVVEPCMQSEPTGGGDP